jgi:hypothetical protein
MVGYGTLSLCVTYKEGLCPSSGDINRLMMKKMKQKISNLFFKHANLRYFAMWYRFGIGSDAWVSLGMCNVLKENLYHASLAQNVSSEVRSS